MAEADAVRELVTPPARKLLPNVALFLLSVLTMLVAGAMQEISGQVIDILRAPELLSHGVIYTLALLGVLVAHDLGHFAAAQAHGVEISFPYYLPAPTLLGTLGTLVTIERPTGDKRALFDVAAAGPLAGVLVAVPMAVVGILWSEPNDAPYATQALTEPLLFDWLVHLLKPEAIDVGLRLHPLALAAWTGLLVTALNLLPVGQLDGGHLAYALFGRAQAIVGALALAALVAAGVLMQAPLWIVWALIVLLIGHRHPPMRETTIQIGGLRYAVAGLIVLLMAVSFSLHPGASFGR